MQIHYEVSLASKQVRKVTVMSPLQSTPTNLSEIEIAIYAVDLASKVCYFLYVH